MLASKSDKCLFVGYPKKQKGTTFTSHLRTKCSLLVMESFWKESSFPKESVGVRHLL